jgi:hypothetical protein
MKNAHLLRYPCSSSLRRTFMYASLLGTAAALHLSVFDQPAEDVFMPIFHYSTIPVFQF